MVLCSSNRQNISNFDKNFEADPKVLRAPKPKHRLKSGHNRMLVVNPKSTPNIPNPPKLAAY